MHSPGFEKIIPGESDKMFRIWLTRNVWWYECDGRACKARTGQHPGLEPPTDSERAWKVAGYNDLHFCPECRKLPEIAAIIQDAESETRNIMGLERTE